MTFSERERLIFHIAGLVIAHAKNKWDLSFCPVLPRLILDRWMLSKVSTFKTMPYQSVYNVHTGREVDLGEIVEIRNDILGHGYALETEEYEKAYEIGGGQFGE